LLASRQIAQAVERAVAQLPDDLRQALVLREMEGLSYEEIATLMDCPVGTVRSRIFRAREAVSKQLEPLLDRRPGRRW
jgi:RNA polymerase sigma-70 factor (ECF subfamily)